MAIIVARGGSAETFGRFALLLAVLAAVNGIFRTLAGGWILVEGGAGFLPSEVVLRGSLAFGSLSGMGLGLVMVVMAALAGFRGLADLVAFGLVVSAQFVLMAYRLNQYRTGRPRNAALISLGVCATFVIVVIAGSAGGFGWSGLTSFQLFVGLNVGLSAMLIPLCGLPRPSDVAKFFGLGADSWRAVSANLLAAHARTVLLPFTVTLGGGATATAGYRGAQTLAAAPVQVPQGLQAVFQARMVQQRFDKIATARTLRNWVLVQLCSLGPFLLVAAFLPSRIGTALLGETWEYAERSLPWILLGAMVAQLGAGAEMFLRTHGGLKSLAVCRGLLIPPVLVGTYLLAVQDGARGAAIALLVDNMAIALLAGWLCRRGKWARDPASQESGA